MQRTALVTGGSRGIGRAVVEALAASGHRVAINCLDDVTAAESALSAIGGAGLVARADVRDRRAVTEMVARVRAELGPIHVLVHSPNLSFPMGPFWKLPWPEVARKIEHEVGSFHALAAELVPEMIAGGWGRIVAISSMMSRHGSEGFGAHAAAKSALDAAVHVLAREVGAHGVTANVVAPGATDTRSLATVAPEVRAWVEAKTPARRLGRPEDVAGIVALLCSEGAGWLNGAWIAADGGLDSGLPFTSDEIVRPRT